MQVIREQLMYQYIQVPTKTFKTNEKLAETPAQKTLDVFKKALTDIN